MSDTAIREIEGRAVPAPGTYALDTAHTTIEFVGRHLMITKVRGRFSDVSGTIMVDEEPERSHVEVEIKVASIDTGDSRRDDHLRGPDFFDAEKYPTITFRSNRVACSPSSASPMSKVLG